MMVFFIYSFGEKIMIINSADENYWTALRQNEGFLKGLEKGGYTTSDLLIKTFFMDTNVKQN